MIYVSEGIHSQIKLFADDCLVYRNVQTSADQQILQQDLNILMKWADKWQMKFNINKCKIMQISNHDNKIYCIYTMDGTPLMTTEQHSYLGVQLHHKLSWEPHIDYICSKANRTLGFPPKESSVLPHTSPGTSIQAICVISFRVLLPNMGSTPSEIY